MCIRKIAGYFNKSAFIGLLLGALLVIIYNNVFKSTVEKPAPVKIKITAKNEEPEIPINALKKLYYFTNCKTKILQTTFKQHGDFWVLYNYVKAKKNFRCYESITYATQGDYKFLGHLENLVERWKGPVSVALYAPGHDFQLIIDSIAYLRNCDRHNFIKDYVTFHVYFETKNLPQVSTPLSIIYNDTSNCSFGSPLSNVNDDHKFPNYPINLARNIARESAQTHFILSADIDLYPSKDFIRKFFQMIEKREDLFRTQTRKVFVLPIFEVVETANIPENKTYLKRMLFDGTAILFRSGICPQCHRVIKYDVWLATKETEGLDVIITGKRKGLYKNWEPIFVGTHTDPLFSEELDLGNQENRMIQAYAMCLLDYNFMVLDNAFLIHKPGITRRSQIPQQSFSASHEVDVVKKKIETFLGKRDGCY